jgi:hypothetical protein
MEEILVRVCEILGLEPPFDEEGDLNQAKVDELYLTLNQMVACEAERE